MPRLLPARANIEHLRNEAKALVRAYRQHDPAAGEILRHLPRYQNATDERLFEAGLSLQQVQHALALSYGFAGWKALIDHVAGSAAFQDELKQTLAVFTAKGPAADSTGSEHEQRRHRELERLIKAGDSGIRVMRELARSANGRARNAAALFFGLSPDPRATTELNRLLSDPAVMVRSRALRFFASRIHPDPVDGSRHQYQEPASSVPEEITAILPLARDPSPKVALEAIACLSAYARFNDRRITRALKQALADPRHKVQHAAARVLGVACPGCSR